MTTPAEKLRTAEIMSRNVLTLREETTVSEAAAALIERRISGAPVTDAEGKLLGILSEEDLIGAYYEGGKALAGQRIGACEVLGTPLITRKVVSAREETPVAEVAKRLMSLKIKRMPVIDAAGKVVGVVSRKDILKALVR